MSTPIPPDTAAGHSAENPPEPVLAGRARIDALDRQIGELILRRIEVSRAIQAARIADGGRRVDLRRESEIIGGYRAALGKPGTAIAMALLELCRGRA
ncbi:MAG TPA: chorismate mutase [Actinocrinis sp.]|jgi:chorismate mutase